MSLAIFITVVFAAFAFVNFYFARPEFPPLPTDKNDPLMQEAREKAKSSVPQFLSLYPANKDRAVVKIKFITNSDEVEYLWAEVKSVEGDRLSIFLVTPPVTHGGTLDRHMTIAANELEDWQIIDENEKIYGAFTQKAMLKIAKAQWGKLPKKLQKLEALYIADP